MPTSNWKSGAMTPNYMWHLADVDYNAKIKTKKQCIFGKDISFTSHG